MKHGLRRASRKPLGASSNGRNARTGAIHAPSLERGLPEPLGIESFVVKYHVHGTSPFLPLGERGAAAEIGCRRT